MYRALAKYYDAFMSDVDYDKWTDYICAFINGRKSGVDAGCGTGRFTVNLIKRGYDVYGVDISPKMLNVALRHAKKSGVNARFVQGDIQSFEFLKKVGFVTAICDTFNYIKDPLPAFENIYAALENDGVFIFDISTEYKLTQILAFNTYSDSKHDITYIWNNYYNAKAAAVEMELTFFERDSVSGLYKKTYESQIQYIHTVDKLKGLLKEAGFKRVDVFSAQTMNKLKETDERAHFTVYK